MNENSSQGASESILLALGTTTIVAHLVRGQDGTAATPQEYKTLLESEALPSASTKLNLLLLGDIAYQVIPNKGDSWNKSRWLTTPPNAELRTLRSDRYGHPPLQPGATVLLAPTGWGKSVLAKAVHDAYGGDGPYVLASELPTLENYGVAYPSDNVAEMLAFIANWLLSTVAHGEGPTQPCLVDGIRETVYGASDGGTGEGGLNMFIGIQLTALSRAIMDVGGHALLLMNPMTATLDADEAAQRRYALVRDLLVGSTSTWAAEIGKATRTLRHYDRGPLVSNRDAPLWTVPERTVTVPPPRSTEVSDIVIESGSRPGVSGRDRRELRAMLGGGVPPLASNRL